MTKDEALKLALSALDEVRQETFRLMRDGQTLYAEDNVWSTIISIKEALAQPEQEPVAWISVLGIDLIGQKFTDVRVSLTKTDVASIPLYTHPVKDLEDIVINITWNENSMRDFGKDELNFARAILRKAQNK